jgi:hypothetical protein
MKRRGLLPLLRLRPIRLLLLVPLGLMSCGEATASTSTLTFATPRALTVDCAQPPATLQARLWVSGSSDPCFLEVDVAAGSTSGDCEVAPGIKRRFTIDWFIDDAGREVVLAQAQTELDLSRATKATAILTLAEDDIVNVGCKDMSVDSFAGADTVTVDGRAVPVCDVDADNEANIVEVCAGGDPFGG